jgi:hypothetical protein
MVAYGQESALKHGDVAGSLAMDFVHDESSLITRVRERRLHRNASRANIWLTPGRIAASSELLRLAAASALSHGVSGELSIATDNLDYDHQSLLQAYGFKAQSSADSRLSIPNPQKLIINIANHRAIDDEHRRAANGESIVPIVPGQLDRPAVDLADAETVDSQPVLA